MVFEIILVANLILAILVVILSVISLKTLKELRSSGLIPPKDILLEENPHRFDVTIDGIEVISMTTKAVLIESKQFGETWVAISLIENGEELHTGYSGSIKVPGWLARKKGIHQIEDKWNKEYMEL